MRKREQLVTNRLNNAQASSYTENDVAGNYTVTTTNGNGVAWASNAQTREDGGKICAAFRNILMPMFAMA